MYCEKGVRGVEYIFEALECLSALTVVVHALACRAILVVLLSDREEVVNFQAAGSCARRTSDHSFEHANFRGKKIPTKPKPPGEQAIQSERQWIQKQSLPFFLEKFNNDHFL
jgi:hypothetical protein